MPICMYPYVCTYRYIYACISLQAALTTPQRPSPRARARRALTAGCGRSPRRLGAPSPAEGAAPVPDGSHAARSRRVGPGRVGCVCSREGREGKGSLPPLPAPAELSLLPHSPLLPSLRRLESPLARARLVWEAAPEPRCPRGCSRGSEGRGAGGGLRHIECRLGSRPGRASAIESEPGGPPRSRARVGESSSLPPALLARSTRRYLQAGVPGWALSGLGHREPRWIPPARAPPT